MAGPPPVDLALAHRDQRHVRRRESTGFGRGRVAREPFQRGLPCVRQLPYLFAGEDTAGEAEGGAQAPGATVAGDSGGHIQRGHHRQVRGQRRQQAARFGGGCPSQATHLLGQVCGRRTTEVVERDLPRWVRGQFRPRPGVQVAQQAVSDALVGDRQQLFLDGLHQVTGRRAARADLVGVVGADVEPDRGHAGEPADRAGQVGARNNLFLAAVAFEADQDRGVAVRPPLPDRDRQRGEQPVVGTAAEGRGQGGEQEPGHLGGQLNLHAVPSGHEVDRGVQGPRSQQRVRAGQYALPQHAFRLPAGPGGLLDQGVRPAPYGRGLRRQLDGTSLAHPSPRRGQVGEQDLP